MTRSRFLIVVWVGLLAGIPFANGQDSPPVDHSLSSLRAQALVALQQGDSETAIQSADAMLRLHSDDARALRLSADVYLRTGKVEDAARLFDRYVKEHPEELPDLWQRGIALYFIGDFKRGAEQFEEHRKVNPHDVENAAWHFLCISRAESLEAAKKAVLPAPNDQRPPMEEVLGMLSTGNTAAVTARVNQFPEGSEDRTSAAFYGNFYLGLYADATGDKATAKSYLDQAAQDAPHHYMGDLARVYAQQLAK